jgi:putative DNA primase/helicase
MTQRVDEALEIARLAALDPLSYEREREASAEKLGIRVAVLDRLVAQVRNGPKAAAGQGRLLSFPEIEPWDEAVDGAELLDVLCRLFGRFVVMTEAARTATALWAVHTYLVDAALCTPRLVIKSAQKRSGKTTLLTLLTGLVQRPLSTASLTAAALYRAVEMAQPCLLIDEADHFAEDGHRQELKALLNAGFQRGGQVLRVIGEDHEPRQFACWCPVALALIGKLWDTLEDRSVRVVLQRRRRDEDIDRLRLDRLGELAPLTRRMQRWANDHRAIVAAADPAVPRELNDRAADCWRPMLAIADRAGGLWPAAARQAAVALSSDEDDLDTLAVRLLRDIKELFDAAPSGVLFSSDIVASLLDREERGWAEMGRAGKPLSKVSLARLLDRFRIRPGTVRRGFDTAKGYARDQFDDAFERYL